MKYFLNGGGNEIACLQAEWFKNLTQDEQVSKLLLIPLAIIEDAWQQRWHGGQVPNIHGLELSAITTYSTEQEIKRQIAGAQAIYFPGGSQSTLVKRATERGIADLIRQNEHLRLLGGGSAGEMSLGTKTIVGRHDVERVIDGLGFIPNHMFDSHFGERNREDRLINQLLAFPGMTGVGIDENTTLILNESHQPVAVFGPGTVHYYQKDSNTNYDSDSTFPN